MTGILAELKWETLQKRRRKDNRLIWLYKGLKGKARVPTDDIIPKIDVAETNTLCVHTFKHDYLLDQRANCNQISSGASLWFRKGCIRHGRATIFYHTQNAL